MNFTFNLFVNCNYLRIVLLAYKYWRPHGIRVVWTERSFISKHKNYGLMHKNTQYSYVKYNSNI